MKKFLLLAAAAMVAGFSLQAKTVDEFRIYLNAGHGGYGPNDRPMATVSHPNTTSLTPANTNPEDTMGFFEGRGTLPRSFGIGTYLKSIGVKSENIVYSRLTNGPFPYDHNAADAVRYQYNRDLAEIDEEVEAGNFDMFISSHSNAATDGTSTNYPLFLYRGYDNGSTGDAGYTGNAVEGSYDMAKTIWPYHYMSDIEPQSYYSKTNINVRGDINFYGSYSTATRTNGKKYSGYLGVLKHGVPGYLLEGFFHTYQPARHRALNFDYDRLEGLREARGVAAYFGFTPNGKGEIVGTVKDEHEKIVEDLFKYAYGSDDQWLPINGATVTLKKNGSVVNTNTCDGDYNGFYAFFDLEPGDYTIEATKDGYKVMDPIAAKVTANETSYNFIKLENEDFVPEEVVYENYPEPVQPGYIKLAGKYIFDGDNTAAFDFAGTIKDVAQRGDSIVVLTNDGLTPHLYLLDAKNQSLTKELSVEGLYSEDSPGFFSPLNAITFTADNKLVGVSLTFNQYSADYVDAGYQRGTARVYIWDNDTDAPRLWGTTTNSGNYFRAVVGQSIAVNGSSKNALVLLTAVNQGASPYNIRLVHMPIEDNVVGTVFHDNLYSKGFTANAYAADQRGAGLKIAVSPNDDGKLVLGGAKGLVAEFDVPTTQAGVPSVVESLSNEFGIVGNGFGLFKYAKHNLMVAPYTENDAIKGIKLIDITDGLGNAALIKTENSDLTIEAAAPATKAPAAIAATQLQMAKAIVDGADIDAYLVSDSYLTRFTAKADDQPAVKGIYAYDLNYEDAADGYTFTFKANDDAKEAYITFRDKETGEELATIEIPNVKVGENEITLTNEQLPGELGDKMNWEITLVGEPIASINLLNTPDDWHSTTSLFSTVDNNPESDFFGRIYVNERAGQPNENNGLWIYDQMWNKVNSSVLRGGLDLRSPYRVAVAPDGYVFFADWSDPASGVFIMDPANPEGEFTQFFDGTRNSAGLFSNAAGEPIGSSSTGIGFVGKGANTKMYAHLEDQNESIFVYNVGQEDGTIAHTWSAAPVATGLSMANGNVSIAEDPTTGGVWISQIRGAGNNTSSIPSFYYLTPDNEVTFNSGRDLKDLTGSLGAGLAVSNDGKELVVNNGEGKLEFFNVAWNGNTPVLTAKGYTYTATVRRTNGTGHTNYIYQIHYDPAGNLICSGDQMGVYSMPTDDNRTTTPAKMAYVVTKGNPTGINTVNAGKNVVSVKYVNLAGIESTTPFQGVNIVVTRYDDGSQTATKVIK